jgi:hypothetical protein
LAPAKDAVDRLKFLRACVNMVTNAVSQCDQISFGVFVGAK